MIVVYAIGFVVEVAAVVVKSRGGFGPFDPSGTLH
jgi:hypothetical protein